MKRRLVDCGFIVGVLELSDDGKPMLSLLQPETEDSDPKTLMIWDTEGLFNLQEELHDFLVDWAAEEERKKQTETHHAENED